MKTRADALGGKIIVEAKKLNIPIEPSAYQYDNLALVKNPIAIIGLNETLYDANNGEELAPEEFLTRITACASEGKDIKDLTKSDGGGRASFRSKVHSILSDLEDLLVAKNEKYGNSAFEPVRIFSQADPIEQLKVRIDDKLSRMAAGTNDNEDTVQDLMGYLVLLKIAQSEEG